MEAAWTRRTKALRRRSRLMSMSASMLPDRQREAATSSCWIWKGCGIDEQSDDYSSQRKTQFRRGQIVGIASFKEDLAIVHGSKESRHESRRRYPRYQTAALCFDPTDGLSNGRSRWRKDRVPRSRRQRQADTAAPARRPEFVEDVRRPDADARRSLSPDRARLSRLRQQRCADAREFRVHVRSPRGSHAEVHGRR